MAFAAPGYSAAELILLVTDGAGWDNPSTAQTTKAYQAITNAALAASTWNGAEWWWMRGTSSFKTGYGVITATGLARVTNVVTVTTSAAHGLIVGDVGQIVVIKDADASAFDGQFPVASVTSTVAFTYAQTAGNATSGSGTATVYGYPLPTTYGSGMAALRTLQRVYYDDDWPLETMDYRKYREWYTLDRPNASNGRPLSYAITGDASFVWLHPGPDAAYTVYTDFVKRHTKVTSSSVTADLIVPAEYQDGIYVHGAIWLLRHEITDVGSLKDCAGFVEAMNRMEASKPIGYDRKPVNLFAGVQGTLPSNLRIQGGSITNPVS